MRNLRSRGHLNLLILYVLLTFPFFYFVYKFGILTGGYEDAKSYLKLFVDFRDPNVPCPFNMRLLTPILVNLLHKTGLFYNTECAIDAFPQYDKTYFFSNVFFNFICVTLTSFSLFLTFTKLGFSRVISFLSGVLFLLGFGTIFFMMMPGVDSLSVLLFTWLLFFYLKRSYWVLPFFVLLILQREYFFLLFIVLAFLDYFRNGKMRYYLYVFFISFVCWGIYFLLRKYVFLTPHWHYQTSAGNLTHYLLNIQIDLLVMFRQTFMTMNIYFIYLLVLLYKYSQGLKINKYYLLVTVILFVQITLLSIATTSGNNNGRYFYFATPFFIYLIALEISPYLKIEWNAKVDVLPHRNT